MKHFIAFFIFLFLASFSASCTQQAQEGAENSFLAIRGGTLIDGTGAPPTANGVILVRDNKILRISSDANQPVPPGARVVEAEGKYVLPA